MSSATTPRPLDISCVSLRSLVELLAYDHSDYIDALIKSSFETGDYSDLTITCKGRVFKVHRMIVCPRSKPLAAAVNGNFQEAVTGVIDLEDDDPDEVFRMLEFLYRGHYQVKPPADATSKLPINFIIHMKQYILADKYDIPVLQGYAAIKYRVARLEEADLSSFVQSLRLLYANLPPETHRLIYEDSFEMICLEIDLLNMQSDFKELVADYPELAQRIIDYLARDRDMRKSKKARRVK